LIAGRTVREGITMGHAGAMIQGGIGTIASKTEALATAGAQVFTRIRDLIEAVAAEVGKGEQACS
jgi:succinyl-CoA synthetase alpha subunit